MCIVGVGYEPPLPRPEWPAPGLAKRNRQDALQREIEDGGGDVALAPVAVVAEES